MSGDQAVLRLRVAEGDLVADAGESAPQRLAALQAGRDCGVSVRLDLDAHRADIRVDGRMVATAVTLPDKALDRLAITTGVKFVGELFVAPMLLHRGYALRERFISVPEGTLPDGWTSTTAGGKVAIHPHGGAAHVANSRALCLERTQTGALDATVSFPPVKSAVEVEVKVQFAEGGNGASVGWLDAAGRPVVTLVARDGTLTASDAGETVVVSFGTINQPVSTNRKQRSLTIEMKLDARGEGNYQDLPPPVFPVRNGKAKALSLAVAGSSARLVLWAEDAARNVCENYTGELRICASNASGSVATSYTMRALDLDRAMDREDRACHGACGPDGRWDLRTAGASDPLA